MPPKPKSTKGLGDKEEKLPSVINRDFLLFPLDKVPISDEDDNLRLISIFVSGKLSSGPEQKKKNSQRVHALKEALAAQDTAIHSESTSPNEKGRRSPLAVAQKGQGTSTSVPFRSNTSIVTISDALQFPPLKHGHILPPIGTYTDFEIQMNDGMSESNHSLKSTCKTGSPPVVPSKPFFTLQVPDLDGIVSGGLPTQEMTAIYQTALQSTLADMNVTFDEYVQNSITQSRALPGRASSFTGSRVTSNSKRDAAAAAAAALQQRQEEKQPHNTIRALPTCEVVDDKDGSFKIEIYRDVIPINCHVVDQFLSKSFKFGVHAIPTHMAHHGGKGNVTFSSTVDVKEIVSDTTTLHTVTKGSALLKKRGSVDPHIHDKSDATSRGATSGAAIAVTSGIIASSSLPADPSAIPLSQTMCLLEHEFDLSGVFKDSVLDRIDIVVAEDEKYGNLEVMTSDSEELKNDYSSLDEGKGLNSMSCTAETKTNALTKSQSRRARQLHVNAFSKIPGFESLTISIVCRRPIFSPVNLKRFLPMIVEVSEVNNLPPLQTCDLRHTMNPRKDEIKFASSYHKTATVCGSFDTESLTHLGGPQFDGVSVQYRLLGDGDDLNIVTTKRHHHERDISFHSRKIIFLYKYSNQQIIEFFFFKGLRFEIHDRDEVRKKGDLSGESQVQDKINAPAVAYGVVDIRMRKTLIGDNGTASSRYVINHQVTPTRECGNGTSYCADYLSNGTTLKAKIHILTPLPVVKYTVPSKLSNSFPTNSSNSILCKKYHLSRAVFVFPYRFNNIKTILQVMMGSIIRQPIARGPTAAVSEEVKEEEVPQEPPKVIENVIPAGGIKKGGNTRVEETNKIEVTKPIDYNLPRVLDEVIFTVPEGISGFEVIDDDMRIICLEGYVHVIHSIVEIVTRALGEAADKDPSIRIIFNTDLQFPQRWYHEWPPLVKLTPELAKYGSTSSVGVYSDVGREEKDAEPRASECASPVPSSLGVKSSLNTKGKKKTGAHRSSAAEAKAKKEEEELMKAAEKAREAEEEKRRLEEEEEEERKVKEGISLGLRSRSDLDGGGVGGRIRRLRLNKTIRELLKNQRNFIKQSHTKDTLICIQKLVSLRDAPSMVCAIDHDFFPTADEIVAIERVYGASLEIFDICGSEEYFSFVTGDSYNMEDVIEQNNMKQLQEIAHRSKSRSQKVEKSTDEILESGLELSHIGRTFDFIAIPANGDQRAKLTNLGKNIFPRYRFKNYMMLCKNESPSNPPGNAVGVFPLVCCFSAPPPTQLIRYYINAQVVGAFRTLHDTTLTPVLFVIGLETVSKNSSDHKNPCYEEVIHARAMRVHPKRYKQIIAQKNSKYISIKESPYTANEKQQVVNIVDSDEEDQEDFVDPPPYNIDEGDSFDSSGVGINRISVIDDYVLLNKDVKTSLKKCNRSIHSAGRPDIQEEYQRCWELYNLQGSRLAKLDTSVSKVRAIHNTPFLLANKETSAIHPEASYAKADKMELEKLNKTAPHFDEVSENRKVGQSLDSYNSRQHSLPPMKFHCKRDISEKAASYSDDDLHMLTTVAAEAKDQQDRIRKDRELWLSKMKVDDMHFSVSTKLSRDKAPCVLDKYEGLLNDPPKKKALKMFYAPVLPLNAIGGATVVPNKRIEPKDSKHPDVSQFYYANSTIGNVNKHVTDIADEEKQSPLWGKLK